MNLVSQNSQFNVLRNKPLKFLELAEIAKLNSNLCSIIPVLAVTTLLILAVLSSIQPLLVLCGMNSVEKRIISCVLVSVLLCVNMN